MTSNKEIQNAEAIHAQLTAKAKLRFLETGRGWLDECEWREFTKAERVLMAAGLIQAEQPIWSE